LVRAGGRQRSSGENRVDEDSELFVRALARGLSILVLFDIEHPAWSLNEICEQTRMSKTTAYRMLRTLEAKDFLEYDPTTERYHLGKAAIPPAYLALSSVGFVRAAHPWLEELAAETGETVELTVGGPDGAIVVDQVATSHPFRLNTPTGRKLSGLASSSWRLHVAFRRPEEQEKYLKEQQHKLTSHTVTDPDELRRRLEADKAEQLSCDLEELDLGVCAVSAPVFERDGSLKAVVTLVAPAERFGPREKKKHIEALRNTATKLSRQLDGQSPAE
jgi:DNA-binding IclR family transcriptional regulator